MAMDDGLLKGVYNLAEVYAVDAIAEAVKHVQKDRINKRRLEILKGQLAGWRAGLFEIETAAMGVVGLSGSWPDYAKKIIDNIREVVSEMGDAVGKLEAGNG